MKKFTRKILKNQLNATDEEIKIILDYQESLSVITDAEEEVSTGFIVDGRELYNQLNQLKKGEVDDQFTKWIKRKITNSKDEVRFIENVDYVIHYRAITKNGNVVIPMGVENLKPQERSYLGIGEEYKLTVDMAKQLCMLENNSIGFNTRRYFILCEKFLKHKIKWEEVRSQQKISYDSYKKEFMNYMIKNKLLKGYDTRFYPYAFDALNLIALGKTAKEVQHELDILDRKTRDNLEIVYNDRLDFLQETFVTCFKLNISNNQILPYVFKEVQEKYGVNYSREFNQKICKYNYLFR